MNDIIHRGDTIYRQAAIESVCEEVMGIFSVSLSVGYDVAEAALEKLPPAQPEPKRGKWEETESEKVIEELEGFKSELLKVGNYQAQVDILTKAINLLKNVK